MASTVPTPSNADILAWTEGSLRDSHVVRRLKPLFEALGLRHLDRDDPARGARRGRGYAKDDYVRALLAHQQSLRGGGVGASTTATFAINDIVQLRSDALLCPTVPPYSAYIRGLESYGYAIACIVSLCCKQVESFQSLLESVRASRSSTDVFVELQSVNFK
eukprot:COSAG02_NODE_5974_length_3901_cov_1.635455_2_plen_162_part_00